MPEGGTVHAGHAAPLDGQEAEGSVDHDVHGDAAGRDARLSPYATRWRPDRAFEGPDASDAATEARTPRREAAPGAAADAAPERQRRTLHGRRDRRDDAGARSRDGATDASVDGGGASGRRRGPPTRARPRTTADPGPRPGGVEGAPLELLAMDGPQLSMAFPRPGRALWAVLIAMAALGIATALLATWGRRREHACSAWLVYEPSHALLAAVAAPDLRLC